MDFRFPKKEKLKSRKLIEQLFAEGESLKKFPVQLLYIATENETHRAAFAVPKKNFKSAVTRNRIKRQMREAYRLQKELINQKSGKKFALLFLYISKDKPQYDQLFSSIGSLLKKS